MIVIIYITILFNCKYKNNINSLIETGNYFTRFQPRLYNRDIRIYCMENG